MKAITLTPHKAATARLEDVSEPDAHGASIPAAACARRVRHRRRDGASRTSSAGPAIRQPAA